MDYSKLSQVSAEPATPARVNDSAFVQNRRAYLATKQKLADSIAEKDSKKIYDSAIEALKDSTPEHVIRALINLLGKKDSAPARKKYAEFKVADSYVSLKKKIKDEMVETETTDDAIEVVQNALETAAPEEVVAAAVEILAETIDVLEEKVNAAPADTNDPEEDYIEDSVTHKGKLRVKDSFVVGEPFEGNGIKGKVKEVLEDKIIVETQNEDGDIEDKEVLIKDIC